MSSLLIFLIVAGMLFALPFVTKRRLGLPALALAAGATLSHLWVGNLTPIVASAGFVLVRPPLESVVATGIILLPAVLLLFSSPSYSSLIQRIIGSTAFALLAIALLLEPLGSAIVIEGMGEAIYHFLTQQQATIITFCLVLALTDLFLSKKAHRRSRSADKH